PEALAGVRVVVRQPGDVRQRQRLVVAVVLDTGRADPRRLAERAAVVEAVDLGNALVHGPRRAGITDAGLVAVRKERLDADAVAGVATAAHAAVEAGGREL